MKKFLAIALATLLIFTSCNWMTTAVQASDQGQLYTGEKVEKESEERNKKSAKTVSANHNAKQLSKAQSLTASSGGDHTAKNTESKSESAETWTVTLHSNLDGAYYTDANGTKSAEITVQVDKDSELYSYKPDVIPHGKVFREYHSDLKNEDSSCYRYSDLVNGNVKDLYAIYYDAYYATYKVDQSEGYILDRYWEGAESKTNSVSTTFLKDTSGENLIFPTAYSRDGKKTVTKWKDQNGKVYTDSIDDNQQVNTDDWLDMTFTPAEWTNIYTITVHTKEGGYQYYLDKDIQYEYSETYKAGDYISLMSPRTASSGRKFLGYAEKENGSVVYGQVLSNIYKGSDSTYTDTEPVYTKVRATEDKDYYAVYTDNSNACYVTFKIGENDGYFNEDPVHADEEWSHRQQEIIPIEKNKSFQYAIPTVYTKDSEKVVKDWVDESGKHYTSSELARATIDQDTTFTAELEKKPCTITLYAGEGSFEESGKAVKKTTVETTAGRRVRLPIPNAPKGKIFAGYSETEGGKADLHSVSYDASNLVADAWTTVSEDKTYYAVYKDYYKVVFEIDGKDGYFQKTEGPKEKYYNQTYYFGKDEKIFKSAIPESYSIDGTKKVLVWKDKNGQEYTDRQLMQMKLTSDLILLPERWEKTCSITLHSGVGDFGRWSGDDYVREEKYREAIGAIIQLQAPRDPEKKVFEGYAESENGDVVLKLDDLDSYEVRENKDYYAVYTDAWTITFQINSEDGYFFRKNNQKATNLVKKGNNIYWTPTATLLNENRKVVGWTDQNGKTYTNIEISRLTPTSDMILTAVLGEDKQNINITLSPTKKTIIRGGKEQFTAKVTGNNLSDTSVIWRVDANTSKDTKISTEGILSIGKDEKSHYLRISATSNADPSKSAVATVMVRLFKDVNENQYYNEAVSWGAENSVISGYSESDGTSTFRPDDVCTRAQFVTFLWRAMGSQKPKNTKNPFVDIKDIKSVYFSDAVLWSYENGYVSGYSDPKGIRFGGDDEVTRGQVVTFLWRAAGTPKPSSTKSPFTDVKNPSGQYYGEAMLWASENGIVSGYSDPKGARFAADDPCTRGQVVTFLYRYAQKFLNK